MEGECPGKVANVCSFDQESERCSLSDANTEDMEVCTGVGRAGRRMENAE